MLHTTKIILVDDHTLLREALAGMISNLTNYEVLFQAANGIELMEQIGKGQVPDLVLLDIHMPRMNGYATAEWLSQQHPKVKILALSMYNDEQSVIRMFKSGAKGYILKDVQPEELESALHQMVSKGYYHADLVADIFMRTIHSGADGINLAKPVLNEKEKVFLRLACSELTYKEIANQMNLSVRTIDGYREELFEKLHVKSRTGLVLYTIKQGLVSL